MIPTWLTPRSLPPVHRVRELVDIYFAQVHTVRCLGFLHVPSFMGRFQDADALYSDASGLIYIMCALAAPFHYANAIDAGEHESGSPGVRLYDAGRGWAASAMQCMFSNFGNPAVECLMAEVLLHEYHLRVGDHAKAFLVSGIIARHMQILQLNVEHDGDVLCTRGTISCAVKESRRRLLWACYLQDAFIECGIDQLRFISAEDIQIQLPCLEDSFIRNKPCVTETLRPGTLLPFVNWTPGEDASVNLDMRAFYIRAMSIRSRILKYVKSLDGDVPWDANQDSRFHKLDGELVALELSIPDVLKMAPENTYLYKSSGRLNLYFGLHILLAQTFNDLYRVGVSQLVFPSSATKWIRENAPREFIKTCHRMCARKAVYIASLLDDLWKCQRSSMVDIPYAMHTQVCSGVLVTTLWSGMELGHEPLLPDISQQDYRRMLENNVRILQYLRRYIKVDLFLESASQALKRFDKLTSQDSVGGRASSLMGPNTGDYAENPRQFSLDYILNPLGVYPIARSQACDRHKPEEFAASEPQTLGSANTRGQSADDAMSMEDITFQGSSIWDWELQMPLLESMGYPTFLEGAFTEHEAPTENDGQF